MKVLGVSCYVMCSFVVPHFFITGFCLDFKTFVDLWPVCFFFPWVDLIISYYWNTTIRLRNTADKDFSDGSYSDKIQKQTLWHRLLLFICRLSRITWAAVADFIFLAVTVSWGLNWSETEYILVRTVIITLEFARWLWRNKKQTELRKK